MRFVTQGHSRRHEHNLALTRKMRHALEDVLKEEHSRPRHPFHGLARIAERWVLESFRKRGSVRREIDHGPAGCLEDGYTVRWLQCGNVFPGRLANVHIVAGAQKARRRIAAAAEDAHIVEDQSDETIRHRQRSGARSIGRRQTPVDSHVPAGLLDRELPYLLLAPAVEKLKVLSLEIRDRIPIPVAHHDRNEDHICLDLDRGAGIVLSGHPDDWKKKKKERCEPFDVHLDACCEGNTATEAPEAGYSPLPIACNRARSQSVSSRNPARVENASRRR